MNSRCSEEEDHCPPLDETFATSWITQIGEEGLSETEAMDSLIAMNEQRKRTWAQAQELKKVARKGRGFFSPRKEARNRVKGSRKPRQPPHQSTVPTDCDGTPRDLRARLRPENWTATEWGDRLGHGAVWATGTPEVFPGHLIVDGAAGQAMIWGNSLRQMGTEVEERRSPRRAGPHQDGNSEGSGRRSTSHEINDDAHYDRQSPGCVAVHGSRGRHPRTAATELSGETRSIEQ